MSERLGDCPKGDTPMTQKDLDDWRKHEARLKQVPERKELNQKLPKDFWDKD